MKKLHKNHHDEVLTGIIGGIGEYFAIDPTVLRIVFVIIVLISGIFPGIIAYIIAYFIIPDAPQGLSTLVTAPPMNTPEPAPIAPMTHVEKPEPVIVKEETPMEPVVEKPSEEIVATMSERETKIEDQNSTTL